MEDIAIDAVDQLLKSSEWQVNLQSFLDSHCVYFLGDDDGMAHQHGHFDVFREFSTMKEAIVASAVADMGCTPEAFAAACEVRMKGGDTQTRRMLDLLLYLDDFEAPAVGASAGSQRSAAALADDARALPMYMWNKDWPQFVALGQHVIDGRNRGNLSDDDMKLVSFAESVCELEVHRMAGTDAGNVLLTALEAAFRTQFKAVEALVVQRIRGGGDDSSGGGGVDAAGAVSMSVSAGVSRALQGGVEESKSSGPAGGDHAAAVSPVATSSTQSNRPRGTTAAPAPSSTAAQPAVAGSATGAAATPAAAAASVSADVLKEMEALRARMQQMEVETAAAKRAAEDAIRTAAAAATSPGAQSTGSAASSSSKGGTSGGGSGGSGGGGGGGGGGGEGLSVERTMEDLTEDADTAAARRRRREWIMKGGKGSERGAASSTATATQAAAPAVAMATMSPAAYYPAAAVNPVVDASGVVWAPVTTAAVPAAHAGYYAAPSTAPASAAAAYGGTGYYDASGTYYGAAAAAVPTTYDASAAAYDPTQWSRCYDEASGYYYWINSATGESRWEQ